MTRKGGTMRLGAYPCVLREDSLAAALYGKRKISERHRHRYEVNNAYRDTLARHGLVLSGLSPDESLVEMIELADHPWFLGCQFHPEFKSRPLDCHPLFKGFIRAALQHKTEGASMPLLRAARVASVGVRRRPGRRREPSSRWARCAVGGAQRPLRLHRRPVRDREPRQRAAPRRGAARHHRSGSACRSSTSRRSTRPTAPRCSVVSAVPGLDDGLEILAEVQREVGVPVLTDVHEAEQVARRRRGGRRAADAGVPLPADRLSARRSPRRASR